MVTLILSIFFHTNKSVCVHLLRAGQCACCPTAMCMFEEGEVNNVWVPGISSFAFNIGMQDGYGKSSIYSCEKFYLLYQEILSHRRYSYCLYCVLMILMFRYNDNIRLNIMRLNGMDHKLQLHINSHRYPSYAVTIIISTQSML